MKHLPEIPRRTIDELLALYALEPNLKDVFVEGASDQRIVRWFIDTEVPAGSSVGVYSVDEIDVPSSLLAKYKRSPGNRSEVLALCSEIEAATSAQFTRITGIVDRDLSSIIPEGNVSALVLSTDYCCMEAYHFSPLNIEKLRVLTFMRVNKSATNICESLSPILKCLFAIRGANELLATKLTWIDIAGFVYFDKGQFTLRREDFLRSYLQNGGAFKRHTEFAAEVNRIYATLPPDYRLSMNGHDAVQLLGIYLKSIHKKAEDNDRTKPHVLCHLLCCCMRSEELRKEKMFSTLISRLMNNAAA